MQSRKAKQHFLQPPSSSFSPTSLPPSQQIWLHAWHGWLEMARPLGDDRSQRNGQRWNATSTGPSPSSGMEQACHGRNTMEHNDRKRGSLWKDHKRALKDLELYQKTYKMSANHQVLRFKIFRKPCRLAWNGGPAVLNLNGRRDWQLGALQAPSCLEPQLRPNDPLNAETKVLSEIFTIHLYDLVSYNLM